MSRTISTIVDNGDTREAKIQGKRKKRGGQAREFEAVDAYLTSSSVYRTGTAKFDPPKSLRVAKFMPMTLPSRLMRTSPPARSRFGSRPSTTSCGGIAKKSSASAKRQRKSTLNWRRWKQNCAGQWHPGHFNLSASAGDGGRLIVTPRVHVDSREITVQRRPLRTLAVLGITVPEQM
jgi:hypothetical protein